MERHQTERKFARALVTAAAVFAATLSAVVSARADGVSGFANFAANGNASVSADHSTLTLTTGQGFQASSAWYKVPQPLDNPSLGGFTAQFVYNMSFVQHSSFDPSEGITFTLQNAAAGTAALGGSGGGLGYSGIKNSASVQLNLATFLDTPGTVLNTQGKTGQNGGNAYLPTAPVNLKSTHPILVTLSYNNATTRLTETLVDLTTKDAFTTSYVDNLMTEVGGNTAFIGLTGATGAGTSTQTVTDFAFDTTPVPEPAGLTLTAVCLVAFAARSWRRTKTVGSTL
jgi:hypothetical protein